MNNKNFRSYLVALCMLILPSSLAFASETAKSGKIQNSVYKNLTKEEKSKRADATKRKYIFSIPYESFKALPQKTKVDYIRAVHKFLARMEQIVPPDTQSPKTKSNSKDKFSIWSMISSAYAQETDESGCLGPDSGRKGQNYLGFCRIGGWRSCIGIGPYGRPSCRNPNWIDAAPDHKAYGEKAKTSTSDCNQATEKIGTGTKIRCKQPLFTNACVAIGKDITAQCVSATTDEYITNVLLPSLNSLEAYQAFATELENIRFDCIVISTPNEDVELTSVLKDQIATCNQLQNFVNDKILANAEYKRLQQMYPRAKTVESKEPDRPTPTQAPTPGPSPTATATQRPKDTPTPSATATPSDGMDENFNYLIDDGH